eukprot:g67016.t1
MRKSDAKRHGEGAKRTESLRLFTERAGPDYTIRARGTRVIASLQQPCRPNTCKVLECSTDSTQKKVRFIC